MEFQWIPRGGSSLPSPLFPGRIGIWKYWFLKRGENWTTRRKTSRSKDEKQQQTQPTFELNPGPVGGRPLWEQSCTQSPLAFWSAGGRQ